ncbi:MAG: hypothetical protein WAW52_07730 [Methanothrix sp.]
MIDANCCIKYVLSFNVKKGKEHIPVADSFYSSLREFFSACNIKSIKIGYYPFIKQQSLDNLTEAVNRTFDARCKTPYYIRFKHLEDAKSNLNKLFNEKLIELFEKCDETDITLTENIFIKYKKDIVKELNLQSQKSPIPEPSDLKLIACICKEPWSSKYLLSDDGHFWGYQPEINTHFCICVLPLKELRRIRLQWKWNC